MTEAPITTRSLKIKKSEVRVKRSNTEFITREIVFCCIAYNTMNTSRMIENRKKEDLRYSSNFIVNKLIHINNTQNPNYNSVTD